MRMREAAGVPAASYDEWLFRFRVIQRILDELDEELLLHRTNGKGVTKVMNPRTVSTSFMRNSTMP